MLQIVAQRARVCDRFPILSFCVRVPRDRLFEITCTTDPQLFIPENRHRRTPQNFHTTRSSGFLRAPGGQAVVLLPSDQMRRFAGARRLYFALAAYGMRGEDPRFAAGGEAVHIAPDFAGRNLGRGGRAAPPASARYGAPQSPPPLWAGDLVGRTRALAESGEPPCPTGFRPSSPPADPSSDPVEAWGGPPNEAAFGEFLVEDVLGDPDLGGRADAPSDLWERFGEAYQAAIAKPAKELTTAEADLILAMLHYAGMIELKNAITSGKTALTLAKDRSWVSLGSVLRISRDARLPKDTPSLASGLVVFPYRPSEDAILDQKYTVTVKQKDETSKSYTYTWDLGRIVGQRSAINSVDPRFAVALYRIAAYLSTWWNVRAVYHIGINNPASRGHNDGRAIDISGVLWVDDASTDREILVARDWGQQPITSLPPVKTQKDGTAIYPKRWPASRDDDTRYRLAKDDPDDLTCEGRFFAAFYRFLRTQLTSTGPAVLPDDPAQAIVGRGQIMYPDYPFAGTYEAGNGSIAHWNHYHATLH